MAEGEEVGGREVSNSGLSVSVACIVHIASIHLNVRFYIIGQGTLIKTFISLVELITFMYYLYS